MVDPREQGPRPLNDPSTRQQHKIQKLIATDFLKGHNTQHIGHTGLFFQNELVVEI